MKKLEGTNMMLTAADTSFHYPSFCSPNPLQYIISDKIAGGEVLIRHDIIITLHMEKLSARILSSFSKGVDLL